MDLETRIFCLTDFLNSVPKCMFSSYSTQLSDFETNLINSILQDDKDQLINISKHRFNYYGNDNDTLQTTTLAVCKLLHLCCNLNSVSCATSLVNGELGAVAEVNKVDTVTGLSPIHMAAESHAARCVEMLLKKRARTDIKSKDGRGLLALELSLSSSRMEVIWNPYDYLIEDLVVMLSQKDLTTVKLLSEKTKEIAEVGYAIAVGGRVVELAALLMVAAEKVNSSILVLHDAYSGSKEQTTIYESLIREALSLGRATTSSSLRAAKRSCVPTKSESAEKRKLLLCEIELLQLFDAVAHRSWTDKKVTSPLILAAQAGDEAVIELLLKSNIDVNDADAEGNTALHFSLKTFVGSCQHVQQNRIVGLLLNHGARVSQKNKLGLTAVHLAAASGNSQALEVLLLKESDCINSKTIMKETPLFFAAKNDHMDCAELLLHRGANSEVLNLRERPIDLAVSQDMRFLLSAVNICHMNRALVIQQKYTACQHADEVSDTCEALLSMTDEGTNTERICSSMKAEVCKYFESPSGCIRGAKCFYAHGDHELQKTKLGAKWIHSPSAKDIRHKIFVGGLPISMDSESLGDFFEECFGSVEDARVVGMQTEKQIPSRGFGFVTFTHEKSVSDAVQARYVTIMGKQVEIKSAIPKFLLLSELQKQSTRQQEPDHNNHSQLQAPMPGENTTKEMSATKNREEMPCKETLQEAKTELISWANGLLLFHPVTCATESQAHVSTSIEHQNMPKWLRTFKKWLPRFLKHVYKHPIEGEYALSSLKADFKAAFHLELDHASLGYSKLSDFMRTFPDICTVKAGTISKNGSPNHMVLLPSSLPRKKLRILQPLTKHYPSFPVKPIGNSGDSDSNESKCPHSPDFQSVSSEYAGLIGSSIEGNPSNEVPEDSSNEKDTSPVVNSAQESTSLGVPPRFLQFLKPGLFSSAQTPSYQGGDGGSRDPNNGGLMKPSEGIKLMHQNRHLVLQWLAKKRNNSSVFFLREFDFYDNYKASLHQGKCFGCNRNKMMWSNIPCNHLLWCSHCKLEAEQVGGRFDHKCVVCDKQVGKVSLITSTRFSQPVSEDPNFEEFPPLYISKRPTPHTRNFL